jgi:hypothetical protein
MSTIYFIFVEDHTAMTLIKPTFHLSNFEWWVIRMLGTYAPKILSPDPPIAELAVNTWQLYRRTGATHVEIDFTDGFWEEDKAHREKFAEVALRLNNGGLNIPVRSIFFNDLLCLQIGRDYVELTRQPSGWEVCTAIELLTWDHWLVASGDISAESDLVTSD